MRTIIRAVIACAAVVGAMTCAAEINSRSYVRQGLVALYDGIDNAGFGTHNRSAAKWVNLAGDTALDGTVDSHVTWGADGWSVTENCKPITLGNGISSVTATGEYTIQFACTPAQTSLRESFFSQYNGGNEYGIGIEHNDSSSSSGYLRFYSNGGGKLAQANPFGANEFAQGTVTISNGAKDVGFWKNGTSIATQSYGSTPKCNSGIPSVIGGEPWPSSNRTGSRYDATYRMAFRGTYNAFRIYSRALTAEEIKINAAVDAIRFNGASWEDYPELSDYSFDDDGYLQVNFVATAEAGGSVKVDGGAAAQTATAMFAYGNVGETHVISAVPDANYTFYRWTGDTESITEGTFFSPVITVASTKAGSLTAVFKAAPRGLTSLSYVTPGLKALYDGKDNAGYDTYDPNATTWADLSGNGNDGTCASELSWSAKGWSVSGDCKPVTLGNNISAVTATKEYTIQFACTPAQTSLRESFFSQYNGGNEYGIGIEHNDGSSTAGYLRFYSNKGGMHPGASPLLANEYAQGAITVSNKGKNVEFWRNGTSIGVKTYSAEPTCNSGIPSVIGGEPWPSSNRTGGRYDATYKMAFQGTYNAFRLYNRPLTADEIMVNAAVDAIRFNGASASSYTLSGGYSFASDETLLVDVSATASVGGKVALADAGAFASSVTQAVNQCGAEMALLVAKADDGCVFVEWTGDTDAIIAGSIITPTIGVAATRPVALMAVFRKRGGALDGMVLDMEMSSERVGPFQNAGSWHIGNAMSLSDRPYTNTSTSCYYTMYSKDLANYPDYSPNFRQYDIPVPAVPGVTNAAQTCIYFPQPFASTSDNMLVRTETKNACVEGPVATFYVRFLWEGRVEPKDENWSTILLNGVYGNEGLTTEGQGFVLRLRSPANSNRAYPAIYVASSNQVSYGSTDVGTSSSLCIESNRWVDCVVSVYPSPTNGKLSNADIWYCQASASSAVRPVLMHRHIGDGMSFPRMNTSASTYSGIMLGVEKSGAKQSEYRAQRAFRGAIAKVQAWKRVLSEAEVRSLMTGSYGGNFSVGVDNGSADELGADGITETTFNPATMAWRQMKKSLTASDRTLTIEVPLTAENSGLPRMLEIAPLFDGTGATCPVTVTANGSTVGTFDLAKADERAVLLCGEHARRNADGKLVLTVTRPEGCEGTLSFDAISLGGSWRVGTADGAPLALSGPGDSISLCFDVPKTRAGIVGYRYRTRIASVSGDAASHVRLTLNGDTVWPASGSDISAGQSIQVDLTVENVKPGVNELVWHLDATGAGSGVTFDYHWLKMMPPPDGLIINIR